MQPDSVEYSDGGSGPPPLMFVICDGCGAHGPGGYGKERKDYSGAKEDALTQWNKRS